jgi:flavin reductase (DIM6/NTAB) family NADH-FMN oxidoreductase RutF
MSSLGEFVFRSDSAMYAVTARTGNIRAGCLVGSASQVSIEPERFLVAISTANYTHRVATASEALAVHLLSASASDLASLFAETTGDSVDKFAHCSFSDGPYGAPILDAAIGVMVGKIVQRIEFGDHVAHILQPVAVDLSASDATPFSLGQARGMHPGHPAAS